MTTTAPPSRARAGATVAFGILCGLTAGEIAVRTADRAGLLDDFEETRAARSSSIWMRSNNRELIYQHRPNYVKDGIRITERHGILRPVDAARTRAPGTSRVIVLGDSVAAAVGLPYELRVFTHVERILARTTGRPVEVLNFAVNGYGYSTAQEALLLRELAGKFEADALVVQYCVNDFYPTETPTRWFVDDSPLHLLTFVRYSLKRSGVYGYPPASFWENLYRNDVAGWRSVETAFRAIAAYARDRGIPPLLVIFPALSHGGWMEGDATGRHRAVSRLGEKVGFAVLDLLPAMTKYAVDGLRFEPWDTFHLNQEGHALAGAITADRLIQLMGTRSPARPGIGRAAAPSG
jgi:lysophospholipase L1-like esterase